MENILVKGKRNVSKIFILTLIFFGVISALTFVNAADEINLVVGESETKSPLTSDWGGYPKEYIKYIEGDENIVKVERTGKELKGMYEGTKDLKFKALKAGKCTIEVTYYPNMWTLLPKTTTYTINVESIKIEKVSIINGPSKDVYNPGEEIKLDGMVMRYKLNNSEEYHGIDITDENELSKIKLEPKVAPSESGDFTIKVTYEGITPTNENGEKEGIEIYVNPPKQNSDNDEKEDVNNGNNDKNNNDNNAKVYTSNLKIGDTLKLKNNSGWKKYKSKSLNSAYTTMTGGTTFTIEAISENWLTIKGETTYKYLYYGPEASSHFSVVKATENDSNKEQSNNKPTATKSAPQYSDGTSVKKGDSIKMTKGNSWNVYSDSSCKTIKTYIQANKGLTFKVEDINGNFIKLSQNGKEVGYIKWYNSSTGAMSYFAKTGSSPVDTTPDTSKNDVNCSEEMTEALNLMTELLTKILTSLLESLSTACK